MGRRCDQRWRNDPLRRMYVNVSYRTRAAGTDRIRARGDLLVGFYSRRGEVSLVFFLDRIESKESCWAVFSSSLVLAILYRRAVVYFICATWTTKWPSHVRHRTDRGLHDDIRRDRVPTIAQRKRGCTYIGSEITRCRNVGSYVYTPVHVELRTELQALASFEWDSFYKLYIHLRLVRISKRWSRPITCSYMIKFSRTLKYSENVMRLCL